MLVYRYVTHSKTTTSAVDIPLPCGFSILSINLIDILWMSGRKKPLQPCFIILYKRWMTRGQKHRGGIDDLPIDDTRYFGGIGLIDEDVIYV